MTGTRSGDGREGLEIGRRPGKGGAGWNKPGYLLPPAGTEILVELKPENGRIIWVTWPPAARQILGLTNQRRKAFVFKTRCNYPRICAGRRESHGCLYWSTEGQYVYWPGCVHFQFGHNPLHARFIC